MVIGTAYKSIKTVDFGFFFWYNRLLLSNTFDTNVIVPLSISLFLPVIFCGFRSNRSRYCCYWPWNWIFAMRMSFAVQRTIDWYDRNIYNAFEVPFHRCCSCCFVFVFFCCDFLLLFSVLIGLLFCTHKPVHK